MHVGSVVGGVVAEVVVGVVALLLPPAEEEKTKLSVEGQVDPGVHHAVQRQKPEQPDDRICWKNV